MDYPGSVFTPNLAFVPSLSLQRLSYSPNAVRAAWWRAIPNPAYDKTKGSVAGQVGGEYLRVLQSGQHVVIISDSSQVLKRYFPQGDWPTGTVTLGFDPATTPLSLYDWVYPQDAAHYPSSGLSSRTYTEKGTVQRGANPLPQAGTISAAGTAITGAGTSFASAFASGDVLDAGNFRARVSAVTDDTHLTLDAAPPVSFAGRSYGKGRDLLLYSPVARVSLVQDAARTYAEGTDFRISAEGTGLQWLSASNSPQPGQTYSVIYDYLPRYEVTDAGESGPVVNGARSLSMVVAHLWKPETSDH